MLTGDIDLTENLDFRRNANSVKPINKKIPWTDDYITYNHPMEIVDNSIVTTSDYDSWSGTLNSMQMAGYNSYTSDNITYNLVDLVDSRGSSLYYDNDIDYSRTSEYIYSFNFNTNKSTKKESKLPWKFKKPCTYISRMIPWKFKKPCTYISRMIPWADISRRSYRLSVPWMLINRVDYGFRRDRYDDSNLSWGDYLDEKAPAILPWLEGKKQYEIQDYMDKVRGEEVDNSRYLTDMAYLDIRDIY